MAGVGSWFSVAVAIVSLTVCACAATTATARIGGLRREAEARLARCIGWTQKTPAPPLQRQRCIDDSAAFCEQNGLEKTCGTSGLWTWAPPSPR